MNKEEIIEKSKNSLPSLRGGIKGEVIAFEEEKLSNITSPLTPLLKEERVKKAAFTLAETLITLTVLGVIAAITVPSLINKQIESANRTKVKKAMAVYEKALNQMIIDNNINGDVSALNGNTCATTRPYFKTVENGDNNCQFKTADRIWWDISDIQNPIILLKDKITASNLSTMKTNAESLETDKTSFAMIGYIDTNGILRINDKGVAKDNESIPTAKNKTYLNKLYGFMNKEVADVVEPEPVIRSFNEVITDFENGTKTMSETLQELSQNENVSIDYSGSCENICEITIYNYADNHEINSCRSYSCYNNYSFCTKGQCGHSGGSAN